MNINTAIAEANRLTRAQNMKEEGYRASTEYAGGMSYFDVFKPGNFVIADYMVHAGDRTCTCEDFKKNGVDCKHILFVDILKAEDADEEKMWDAACAAYEARIELDDVPYGH